ncbi:MAG: acyltransferase [Pseudomonadota bacterium]
MNRERVLGWDLLRGLCALAVALYHVLGWEGVAELYPLGSYGVYMFFVLSGASLAFNHAGQLGTPRAVGAFLLARWVRLAPLYAIVCGLSLLLFSLHNGAPVDDIPSRLAWNLSFAFGLNDPALSAIAIGGWSLGIEALYYLAFPLLAAAAARRRRAIAAGFALCALQFAWIAHTVGAAAGYRAGAVAYHQAPAFAAYFFGGCVIGVARRRGAQRWPASAAALACAAFGLLLFAAAGPRQGDELLGWRAPVLLAACLAVVWVCGQARVGGRLGAAAQWLGDATYGCYLLHPLWFFGLAWFALPALGIGAGAQAAWRWPLLAAVPVLSCLCAVASERWLERPLRRLARPARRRRMPLQQPEYKGTFPTNSPQQ